MRWGASPFRSDPWCRILDERENRCRGELAPLEADSCVIRAHDVGGDAIGLLTLKGAPLKLDVHARHERRRGARLEVSAARARIGQPGEGENVRSRIQPYGEINQMALAPTMFHLGSPRCSAAAHEK